ncbi:MAG: hypothetical protein ACXVXC_15050 [Nocardioidaceae bacterium]
MPDFTVVRYGTDSSGRPIWMTRFMQQWVDALTEACHASPAPFTPVVVQGAFMSRVSGGGADASAGYHDLGGCVDFRVWDLSPGQQQFLVRETRRRGAGSWIRDAAHGGMDPHCHVLLGCDQPLAAGAAAQWRDYLAGGNGLTGAAAGKDYEWRPSPLVTTWSPSVPTGNHDIAAALAAKTLDARKRALRRVQAHGTPRARKAATAWLTALLAIEAATQKAKAARADLAQQEQP